MVKMLRKPQNYETVQVLPADGALPARRRSTVGPVERICYAMMVAVLYAVLRCLMVVNARAADTADATVTPPATAPAPVLRWQPDALRPAARQKPLPAQTHATHPQPSVTPAVHVVPSRAQPVPDGYCDGRQSLMLIFWGLQRGFRLYMPTMVKQLQLAEWAGCPGLHINVIVHTSLSTSCEGRALWMHRCKPDSRPRTAPEMQTEREELRRFMSAQLPSSVGVRIVESDKMRNLGRLRDLLHGEDRLDAAFVDQHGIILAMRTDVLFDPRARLPDPHPESIRMDVQAACHHHPGFNIIGSSLTRRADFHHRDIDWGFLACDPDSFRVAFGAPNDEAAKQVCIDMGKQKKPAPSVQGFTGPMNAYVLDPLGHNGYAQRFFCDMAVRLLGAQKRFGNVDTIPMLLARYDGGY